LYRNNGDGTFTDISDTAGISKAAGRYGMTTVAADFHDTEVGLASGAALSEDGMEQAGMGLAWGMSTWTAIWISSRRISPKIYPEVENIFPQFPLKSPRIVFRNLGGAVCRAACQPGLRGCILGWLWWSRWIWRFAGRTASRKAWPRWLPIS
jgi:hypothetical protein